MARIYHADLWGPREAKYAWLDDHDLKHTDWAELKPGSPFHLFVPQDIALQATYSEFISVPALFPVNSVGIVTSRDTFVIHFDREALKRRIRQFRDPTMPDELVKQAYGLTEKTNWRLPEARAKVRADPDWEQAIRACLYRPFDERWLFYHPAVIERNRSEVMRHMLAGENVALITSRLTKGETFKHAQVTEKITEVICMSPKTSNNGFVFPLYLYPSTDRGDLFAHQEPSERQPNLNPKIVAALAEAYGREPTPEEMFHYVYAVLYAPAYRQKYAEFLRMDFPRVPFTADAGLFQKLSALGARLVALHLLKSPELDPPACRFDGEGDGRVGKGKKAGLHYEPGEQRVYINPTQYFAPVPEAVWTYPVGGYQVCEKWLKDRRERRLELDDIRTYCRIVSSLKLTMGIQQEIDALYPRAESKTVVQADGG